MRMLMDVQFPIEPFNSSVRDGTAGEKLERIMAAIQPEAAYFTTLDGNRGATLVVNVDSPSDVPRLAEPFFLIFEAAVEFSICMSPEDLAAAGLDELGKEWG